MMRRAFLVVCGSALLAAAMAGSGCGARDPESARVTDEERRLFDRLTRDPFIIVIDQRRDDNGNLIVTTQQGSTHVRYLFAPDSPASKELKIRRIVEEFTMKVGTSDSLGTGPAPRGLDR